MAEHAYDFEINKIFVPSVPQKVSIIRENMYKLNYIEINNVYSFRVH